MKINILMAIVFYYLIVSLGYFAIASEIQDFTGDTGNITFTNTSLNQDDIPSDAGLFTKGVNFSAFFVFLTTGFISGLSGTPQLILNFWTIAVNIIVLGFIISSIWDG